MNKLIRASIVMSGLALSGCISSSVAFVPSSVPLEQSRYTVISSEVSGTCTQVNWLFFTFGKGGSAQRHALDDALANVSGADALVSMAVDEEMFMMVPIVLPAFYKTRVTGTPVKVSAQ